MDTSKEENMDWSKLSMQFGRCESEWERWGIRVGVLSEDATRAARARRYKGRQTKQTHWACGRFARNKAYG